VTVDTRMTATMPEVRGLKIDAARARIQQAGIHALIDSEEKIRAKPLQLPGKPRLDIGDVSAQSLSAGTPVVSSVGEPRRIRLVSEAGP
jgi:beta-lactam-binding protein with PASTA domain